MAGRRQRRPKPHPHEDEIVASVMMEGSQTKQQGDIGENEEAAVAYKLQFSELQKCVEKILEYVNYLDDSEAKKISTLHHAI